MTTWLSLAGIASATGQELRTFGRVEEEREEGKYGGSLPSEPWFMSLYDRMELDKIRIRSRLSRR